MWFDYLGTLGLNEESSDEIFHTNCDRIRRMYFSNYLFIYAGLRRYNQLPTINKRILLIGCNKVSVCVFF